MNAKLIGILALTLVIVGVAWKISNEKAPQNEVIRETLQPELLARINDASRVSLRSDKHATTLVRKADAWVIESKDNFPATASDVKRTLLQIAALRTVEAKTRSASRYAGIGVASIDDEGADGTLLEVATADNSAIVSLIIGHARETQGNPQHYVRRSDDEQSWLVEGALDVPTDPIRWLDATITDVDTARVREVKITAPDEAVIVLRKAEQNDNFFALQNVPDGFEPKSKATISSIGALLLDLRFNDVAAATKIDGISPAREVEVQTFDGLVVTVKEYKIGEESYTQFAFAADPDLVAATDKPVALAEETAAADAASAENAPDGAKPVAAEETEIGAGAEAKEPVAEEIARLSAKTASWIYVLPSYKQRMLQHNFSSLIKEQEKAE